MYLGCCEQSFTLPISMLNGLEKCFYQCEFVS
jgi:hypothetical protein